MYNKGIIFFYFEFYICKYAYRLRSISWGSTPGNCTDTDIKLDADIERKGDGVLITPVRKQQLYMGFTSMPINGCVTFGKKLTNVKDSELSPRPFG